MKKDRNQELQMNKSLDFKGKWRTRSGSIADCQAKTDWGWYGLIKIPRDQIEGSLDDVTFPCRWDKEGKNLDYKDGAWDLIDRVRDCEGVN